MDTYAPRRLLTLAPIPFPVLTLLSSGAQAHSAADPASPAAADGTIAAVAAGATKRSTSLQNTPIAATALNAPFFAFQPPAAFTN